MHGELYMFGSIHAIYLRHSSTYARKRLHMIGASALGQMSLLKTSSWSKVAADFSFFDLKGKTVKHKQVKFWSQEKKKLGQVL